LRGLGELFEHASVESSACGTSSTTGCASSWSSSISVHWGSAQVTHVRVPGERTGSFGGLKVSWRSIRGRGKLTAKRLSEAEPAEAAGAGAAAGAAGAAAAGVAAGAEGAAGAAS